MEKTGQEKEIGKKKFKLEWDGEMIRTLLDKLNEDKENYYLTLTNYTCLIETSDFDYHFMRHLQRQAVFSIHRELKRYMDSNLVDIPNIDRDSMKYYSARIMTKPVYKYKAYNIDINAAYPTCLFNSKMIDQRLFHKLMGLEKTERLAAIGMLAARKRMFTFIAGKVVEYHDNESEYAKYFFHCVDTISKLIWHCEIIAGNSFTHSWVDGLYVFDKKVAMQCKKLLNDEGYKATVSELTDFQYTPHENKIVITFTKDKENKLFNIPIENNKLSQILKYIHYEAV